MKDSKIWKCLDDNPKLAIKGLGYRGHLYYKLNFGISKAIVFDMVQFWKLALLNADKSPADRNVSHPQRKINYSGAMSFRNKLSTYFLANEVAD